MLRRSGIPRLFANIKSFGTASHHNKSGSRSQDKVLEYAGLPLKQIAFICKQIKPEDYARHLPEFFGATVGGHVRHILDHYQAILKHDFVGLTQSNKSAKKSLTSIQYDIRSRNTPVEQHPDDAFILCSTLQGNVMTIQSHEVYAAKHRDDDKQHHSYTHSDHHQHFHGHHSAGSCLSSEEIEGSCLYAPVVAEFTSSGEVNSEYLRIDSNLSRELAFAAHHAIHHLSTIRMMMTSMKYSFDFGEIGVAPSTTQYKQNH